jgi:ATP-dependent RNA helicase DDX42
MRRGVKRAHHNVFGDEDDDEQPSSKQQHSMPNNDQPDEVDPLDAFMADIEKQVQQDNQAINSRQTHHAKPDLDELAADDPLEVFLEGEDRARREQALIDHEENEDDLVDPDDPSALKIKDKKFVPLIPPLDFSSIDLHEFKRDFYQEHREIALLDDQKVEQMRMDFEIAVSGFAVPKPVVSFAHMCFPQELLKAIREAGYASPTAIQMQAVPAAMKGRDVIGIAKTGSGKTGAYLWPLILHVADQVADREQILSPVAIVLAPTRELAEQIFAEAQRFSKLFKLNVAPSYGGMNMHEQTIMLKGTNSRGPRCEIVVATPGRLIDHLKKKHTTLQEATFVVLDEADRMLQMGFEPQVRSIFGQIRPDKQCLMFSATFAGKVQTLASTFLRNPVHIHIGKIGSANKDVKQVVEIVSSEMDKWHWLHRHLPEFLAAGTPLLIFALTKANVDQLAGRIQMMHGIEVGILHGDKLQTERIEVLEKFRTGAIKILVATDVAARGLDIKGLDMIINYDIARDIDSHVHRIGRTGRAGRTGIAYTLISQQKPTKLIPLLVASLQEAKQEVPPALAELAKKQGMVNPYELPQDYSKRGFFGSQGGIRGARADVSTAPINSKQSLSQSFVKAKDT